MAIPRQPAVRIPTLERRLDSTRVSNSGQWVLFTTVDWENLGAEKLYLPGSRWTDRTTYLADVVDGRSTTMSDNGRFVTYWATDASTTIRDLTGGATVTATGSVMAINNDGYYLTRSTGTGPSRLLAGRVLPGGQREPERVAAPRRPSVPRRHALARVRRGDPQRRHRPGVDDHRRRVARAGPVRYAVRRRPNLSRWPVGGLDGPRQGAAPPVGHDDRSDVDPPGWTTPSTACWP